MNDKQLSKAAYKREREIKKRNNSFSAVFSKVTVVRVRHSHMVIGVFVPESRTLLSLSTLPLLITPPAVDCGIFVARVASHHGAALEFTDS